MLYHIYRTGSMMEAITITAMAPTVMELLKKPIANIEATERLATIDKTINEVYSMSSTGGDLSDSDLQRFEEKVEELKVVSQRMQTLLDGGMKEG